MNRFELELDGKLLQHSLDLIFTLYSVSIKNTSSVQRKGADYAARAITSMIQGLGQIFQLFLKIWVMKVIAESMVKKLFVDFLGGKIGF